VENVDLIEVTLEDLGGVAPAAGTEIVIQNVRFRVIKARPPRESSCRRRPRQPRNQNCKWKLLMQKVDGLPKNGQLSLEVLDATEGVCAPKVPNYDDGACRVF
jgi:hypothetical protein